MRLLPILVLPFLIANCKPTTSTQGSATKQVIFDGTTDKQVRVIWKPQATVESKVSFATCRAAGFPSDGKPLAPTAIAAAVAGPNTPCSQPFELNLDQFHAAVKRGLVDLQHELDARFVVPKATARAADEALLDNYKKNIELIAEFKGEAALVKEWREKWTENKKAVELRIAKAKASDTAAQAQAQAAIDAQKQMRDSLVGESEAMNVKLIEDHFADVDAQFVEMILSPEVTDFRAREGQPQWIAFNRAYELIYMEAAALRGFRTSSLGSAPVGGLQTTAAKDWARKVYDAYYNWSWSQPSYDGDKPRDYDLEAYLGDVQRTGMLTDIGQKKVASWKTQLRLTDADLAPSTANQPAAAANQPAAAANQPAPTTSGDLSGLPRDVVPVDPLANQ
jgi:hypothetical protein